MELGPGSAPPAGRRGAARLRSEALGSFGIGRAMLRARVVGRQPHQVRGLRGVAASRSESRPSTELAWPVVSDLAVGICLQLPSGEVAVTDQHAAGWGVGREVVRKAGIEFSARSAEFEARGAVSLCTSADEIVSLLLRPEGLPTMPSAAGPVLMVPDSGLAVIAPADDEVALAQLIGHAEGALGSAVRPVSITPLVLTESGWRPFAWPQALLPAAGRLRRRWDSLMYRGVERSLRTLHARQGNPEVISRHQVFDNADGERVTVAAATRGEATLLPIVDTIMLIERDGLARPVPFARLAEIPGLLEPVPHLEPAYMRLTRFPDECA